MKNTCPYGEKCQFAHGENDLRIPMGQAPNMMNMYNPTLNNKSQNTILNYKIVKCKNWEKDHSCKYGSHCTFAHGDEDLRNKADNLYQFNPAFPFMMMQPSMGMDMAQMQQAMVNNPLMMQMNMNQNNEQFQNNNVNNEEK